MRVYKELEALGFFKWYCTQYGGLNYQEYQTVYDDLPLDNLIRTELNACAFKFFRDKFNIDFTIITNYAKIDRATVKSYRVGIIAIENNKINSFFLRPVDSDKVFIEFESYEDAELGCLKKLMQITG
jgi:hypothetical protein